MLLNECLKSVPWFRHDDVLPLPSSYYTMFAYSLWWDTLCPFLGLLPVLILTVVILTHSHTLDVRAQYTLRYICCFFLPLIIQLFRLASRPPGPPALITLPADKTAGRRTFRDHQSNRICQSLRPLAKRRHPPRQQSSEFRRQSGSSPWRLASRQPRCSVPRKPRHHDDSRHRTIGT